MIVRMPEKGTRMSNTELNIVPSNEADLIISPDADFDRQARFDRINAANEKPNDETPTNVGTLDEASVRNKLEELRTLHNNNVAKDKKGKEDLAKTQQTRLREFLAEGYPQACLLLQDENRPLLKTLVDECGLSMKNSTSALLTQIADLQMGNRENKAKEWKTPARRHERVGQLYRIFHELGWKPTDNIAAKIKEAGGTSAIIDKDKKDSRDPAEEKRIKQRAQNVYQFEKGLLDVPMEDVTVKNTGEWRLALISVHQGTIRVRDIIGKKDDAAAIKARDAYCLRRAPSIIANQVIEDEDDQANAD